MNFDQWYNQYSPPFFPTKERIAKDAWDGCKAEILKVIEVKKVFNDHFLDEGYYNESKELVDIIKGL
jgi:hypothetical protein